MKKQERIFREILVGIQEKKKLFFQSEISRDCDVSLGLVNKTIKKIEQQGCIEKKVRGFYVINSKKIILYWASIRNLNNDIVYKTFYDKPVIEIEKMMPQGMFTAYSGYKYRFKSVPSDYSEVFVYADKNEIEERFPKNNKKPNIFVLKSDKHLEKFKQVPIPQLFVDLWNINTWYAQEFLKALEEKIHGILE